MNIPTYEEATAKDGMPFMPSVGTQIASAQRDRIRSVMDKHIRQLLHSQIQAGLSEMVFALIPSDCDPLGDTASRPVPDVLEKARTSHNDFFAETPAAEIVSFSESDYVRVVRLHGPENTVHFWQQPGVTKALLREVRVELGLSEEAQAPLPPKPMKPVRNMTKAERREYERSISIGTLGKSIGWGNNRATQRLQPGEISVRVNMDELAIRRVTEVGLYETSTSRAVVVRVQVGS